MTEFRQNQAGSFVDNSRRNEPHAAAFPRQTAPRPGHRRVRPEDLPDRGKDFPPVRVLIVDDEPLIRWSMAETLADRGCQVTEAGSAKAGVEAMTTEAIDVVLLDFRLPDSNDLRLLERLRAIAPAAQIILMTAFGSADIRQRALELGAFAVIGKPFEITEVATLVSEAHARRRM